MPREMVVQPQPARSNAEGTQGEAASRGVAVGWTKGMNWVQISHVPDGWETTAEWSIVDLDRHSLNLLIRTLRKARDQAFGRDE